MEEFGRSTWSRCEVVKRRECDRLRLCTFLERTSRLVHLPLPPSCLPISQGSGRQSVAKGSTSTQHVAFGAEAVNDHVLSCSTSRKLTVVSPALVAIHTVFRQPSFRVERNLLILSSHMISYRTESFQLTNTANDRVLLERAKYWDGASVALDKVSFVRSASPEEALAAYRAGEIDAVTNAAFEPLALKLLAGYEDFRRSTFGALTYYSFNRTRAPFDDVRIREALAIAIDRERVSHDHLGGATEPASKFLPDAMSGEKPVVNKAELLEQDVTRSRQLFAEAGFPEGKGFPVVRLLINRNDQQRLVAQAIAGMWRCAEH